MEFTSYSQAQKKVESITGKSNVFFTNEGLEVNFTSDDQTTHINQVLLTLKENFSNVVLVGKKIKSIKINAVGQEVVNYRIIKVEY